MLAGVPLTIAAELDASAVDQRFQRLAGCAIRDLHGDPHTRRRHCVEKSITGRSRPAILIKLSTNLTLWRSGRPKSTFRVRQVWMAASENVSGRPPPCWTSAHARPCWDRTRPIASLACAALQYTRTSSPCDRGSWGLRSGCQLHHWIRKGNPCRYFQQRHSKADYSCARTFMIVRFQIGDRNRFESVPELPFGLGCVTDYVYRPAIIMGSACRHRDFRPGLLASIRGAEPELFATDPDYVKISVVI